MLKRLLSIALVVFAIIGVAAVAGGVLLLRGGIGSRTEPGRVETTIAKRLRAIAIPRAARNLANPVLPSPAAIEDGLSHFADHCASCHGNDGSGQTNLGRS